jgi:hypothetical protein
MKLEDLMTEYGNIQKKDIVGKPEFAHVGGERLQPLCLRAGIEFAPAPMVLSKGKQDTLQ